MRWDELEERGIIAFLMLERLDRVFDLVRDQWTFEALYARILGAYSPEYTVRFKLSDGSTVGTNAPPAALARGMAFSDPSVRGTVAFENEMSTVGQAEFSWSPNDGWKFWSAKFDQRPTWERQEEAVDRLTKATERLGNAVDFALPTSGPILTPSRAAHALPALSSHGPCRAVFDIINKDEE